MKISRCMNPSGHRVTGDERKKSFKKNIDYHYTKKYVIVNVQYQICFEKKLIGAVRGGTYGKDVADVKKRRLRTPGKKKICFTASCGGHMEQLMMLAPLMKEFESFIVTEKTRYEIDIQGFRVYKVPQTNRREIFFPLKFVVNMLISLVILLKEKPDIVISTGALATVPICILAKKIGKKLIYIESFARVTSPNITGKILYRYADQFYVQWESMLDVFPKAQCLGAIY